MFYEYILDQWRNFFLLRQRHYLYRCGHVTVMKEASSQRRNIRLPCNPSFAYRHIISSRWPQVPAIQKFLGCFWLDKNQYLFAKLGNSCRPIELQFDPADLSNTCVCLFSVLVFFMALDVSAITINLVKLFIKKSLNEITN